MARVEPEPVAVNWRQMWLIVQMVWRRWFPTVAERSARAERMDGRAELVAHQRRAAAVFRWTLVRQRNDLTPKDWRDGDR